MAGGGLNGFANSLNEGDPRAFDFIKKMLTINGVQLPGNYAPPTNGNIVPGPIVQPNMPTTYVSNAKRINGLLDGGSK